MKLNSLYEQIKDVFDAKSNTHIQLSDIAVVFARYINAYDLDTKYTAEIGGTPTHKDGPYADAREYTADITFDIEDFISTINIIDIIEQNGRAILLLNLSSKTNGITLDQFLQKMSIMNPEDDVMFKLNDNLQKPLNTLGEYGFIELRVNGPISATRVSNVKKCKYDIILCDNDECEDPTDFEIEQYVDENNDWFYNVAIEQAEEWNSYREDPNGGDGWDD